MVPALVWHIFCVCFASKVIVFSIFNTSKGVIYERSEDQTEDHRSLSILLLVLGMFWKLVFLNIFIDPPKRK